MRKQKLFSRYSVPKYLFSSLTLLCWCAALFQTANNRLESEKAVPAFQNETIPLTDAISAFQATNSQTLELPSISKEITQENASYYCQELIKEIDSNALLLSSHSDSAYSDFYYYSPILKEKFHLTSISANNSNLQIVFTWKNDGSCSHIYVGMPCIEYNF